MEWEKTMNLEKRLAKLNQIGIALSSDKNVKDLLERIVTEARCLTNAEGSSLYLKEEDSLQFILSQNEKIGGEGLKPKCIFFNEKLPLSNTSIAGYVALTGEILNIQDVYKLVGTPYNFNARFDEKNDYRTQSMLVVPMKGYMGDIIGVLAVINARDSLGNVVSFPSDDEPLLLSLSSQAATAYNNIKLTEHLKDAYLDTVMRLSMAAECREKDISGHLQRISAYSVVLAKKLELPAADIECIKYASPMHDVGKIGIPDAILLKPGKLTSDEYEEMKRHTIYAKRILGDSNSRILKMSEEIALGHHEHFDGAGYPFGLKGDDIPISARIVALADVFDALASKRYYKNSWEMGDVISYIKERSGKQFDPKVVKAFNDSLEDFLNIHKNFHIETRIIRKSEIEGLAALLGK